MSAPDLAAHYAAWEALLRGLRYPDTDTPVVVDVMKLAKKNSSNPAVSYAVPLAVVHHTDTAWEPNELLGGGVSKQGRMIWEIVFVFDGLNDGDGFEGPTGLFAACSAFMDACESMRLGVPGRPRIDIEAGPVPFDISDITGDSDAPLPPFNLYGFAVSHRVTFER